MIYTKFPVLLLLLSESSDAIYRLINYHFSGKAFLVCTFRMFHVPGSSSILVVIFSLAVFVNCPGRMNVFLVKLWFCPLLRYVLYQMKPIVFSGNFRLKITFDIFQKKWNGFWFFYSHWTRQFLLLRNDASFRGLLSVNSLSSFRVMFTSRHPGE